MAKLDLVYIGKFTINDLEGNSYSKYKSGELVIEDIERNDLLHKSRNLLDRCEYAVFVEKTKRKVLKKISLI
jgi:hypothetical protein